MWLQWRRLWQRGGQCWDVYRRTATASYGAWRRPPSHVVVVALAAIANDSACTHACWLLARTRLRMRARAPTRRLSINLSIRGVLPIHFTTCQHETRRKRRRRIKKRKNVMKKRVYERIQRPRIGWLIIECHGNFFPSEFESEFEKNI